MSVTDTPITELIPVRLVWDAALGSPPEVQSYGGAIVAVPPEAIPLPQRGRLFGLRGYSRQVQPATPIPWEWVLQGDVDPVDQFVNGLTGRPDGWVDQAAREFVKTVLYQLASAGIPRQTLAERFPLLFNAIKAEAIAELSVPPPLMALGGEDQGGE
jgi:hypothetical protein